MAKITKLTDNSWILRSGDAASGLLFRQDTGYLFLNPKARLTFEDLAAVEKKFGSLKLIERETEQEHTTLNGYPVKYQGYETVSENPPLFTKGGKTVFAAGYWGLRFNQGWTQAFCPKKVTIDSYETVGPFKNRLEMLNHLTSLNNQDNLRSIDANKKT